MRVLAWLAVPGTISALCWPGVRLVRVVLAYRLRCKEIELQREQLSLPPGGQPARLVAGTPSGIAGASRQPAEIGYSLLAH